MARILFIDFLLIGTLYPLFFLCHTRDRIEPGFYRFNLGMAYVPAGVVVLIFLMQPVWSVTKALLGVWMLLGIAATALAWRAPVIREALFIPPALIGVDAIHSLQQAGSDALIASVLGGALLCASIYATVLGHWYLNVQKLAIRPLRNATLVLVVLLVLRVAWDAWAFARVSVSHEGDLVSLASFLGTYEGFLLWVALAFGTVFPLVLSFFVLGTVKIESTQSATGLLYVVLISILMGELSYKFYLLRYSLPL